MNESVRLVIGYQWESACLSREIVICISGLLDDDVCVCGWVRVRQCVGYVCVCMRHVNALPVYV